MYKCDRCLARMHPLQNARMLGTQFVCMPCYERLIWGARISPLAPHVRPLSRWQQFWRWFA